MDFQFFATDGPTDGPTDRQTDRPTNLVIEAPCRSLKKKKPGQWFSALKRMTSYDQDQDMNIDEISHLTNQEQAECIADKFCSVPNEFAPLKSEDVQFPAFSVKDFPQFRPSEVWLQLTRLNTSKSTVPGDFPARLSKHFAAYLARTSRPHH